MRRILETRFLGTGSVIVCLIRIPQTSGHGKAIEMWEKQLSETWLGPNMGQFGVCWPEKSLFFSPETLGSPQKDKCFTVYRGSCVTTHHIWNNYFICFKYFTDRELYEFIFGQSVLYYFRQHNNKYRQPFSLFWTYNERM